MFTTRLMQRTKKYGQRLADPSEAPVLLAASSNQTIGLPRARDGDMGGSEWTSSVSPI